MGRRVIPEIRTLDALHVIVDPPYDVAHLVITATDGTPMVGAFALDRLLDLEARIRSARLVLEHAGPFVDVDAAAVDGRTRRPDPHERLTRPC